MGVSVTNYLVRKRRLIRSDSPAIPSSPLPILLSHWLCLDKRKVIRESKINITANSQCSESSEQKGFSWSAATSMPLKSVVKVSSTYRSLQPGWQMDNDHKLLPMRRAKVNGWECMQVKEWDQNQQKWHWLQFFPIKNEKRLPMITSSSFVNTFPCNTTV